jgi:DNA-binding NarL/FixJ family response regulator
MTPAVNIRVLVVDDQRTVRDGLVMLVNLCEGLEVVGSAADGVDAVGQAEYLRPDVVLMDLRMPEMDGVEATQRITDATDSRVVVLTTYADDESIFPALRAGAAGYLTKDASAEEIEAAIRAVHRGQTWLDPVAQARLVALATETPRTLPPAVDRPNQPTLAGALPDDLTTREIEVLALIGGGLSNAEIGERLFLGQATVKTHVNRIFAKTGVRDRAQAVRYAISHGIADTASS